MKENNYNKYSDISSFEDFRMERERLDLRSKLIEAEIEHNWQNVREMFSISANIFSLAKDVVFPRVSEYIASLFDRPDKESEG